MKDSGTSLDEGELRGKEILVHQKLCDKERRASSQDHHERQQKPQRDELITSGL